MSPRKKISLLSDIYIHTLHTCYTSHATSAIITSISHLLVTCITYLSHLRYTFITRVIRMQQVLHTFMSSHVTTGDGFYVCCVLIHVSSLIDHSSRSFWVCW